MICVMLIILIVIVCPLLLISTYKTVEIANNLKTVYKANKSFKKSIRNTTLIIMPFKINNKVYNFIIDRTGCGYAFFDNKI